ncbi:MAG TPA: glycine--tRNA ligase subunit alpha [Candidatus Azoamicus sp. MARI]
MKKIYFNDIINNLNNFWKKNDCIILQPIDKEVGAATYHPTTFINAINNKKWNAAYTQISKRPSDVQNNKLSNKSIIFHQYQVIMKPSPINIKNLYLKSLQKIGIDINKNEIKFIEDNWKSPSLGAFGIGWEIRLNGIEVTQFTYFQQMGSIECSPIMVEIAYGLERLAMHLQKINNINNIIIDKNKKELLIYSDLYLKYQKELQTHINTLDLNYLKKKFIEKEKICDDLILNNLPLIAYDYVIELSNIFNLIESKICFLSTERQNYISKLKYLTNKIALKIKNDK